MNEGEASERFAREGLRRGQTLGLVAEAMELIDEAIDLVEFAQAPHLRALSRSIQAQAVAK